MSLERMLDITGLEVTLSEPKTLVPFNESVQSLVSGYGNCGGQLHEAITQDPDFLFAQILMGCLIAVDGRSRGDAEIASLAETLTKEKERLTQCTWREQQYAKAFFVSRKGELIQFQDILREILVQHPTDVCAMSMLLGVCIFTGTYETLRDTVARALPLWSESSPFYAYVLSFYSFGLEETNYRVEAAELSYKSLSLQPCSPWATHTICHVVEETRDAEEGVELLERTRKDWENSGLAHHISWHLALYYLDMEQTDKVLKEYDSVLQHSAVADNAFGLIDASSLLWRMELSGCDPGKDRWEAVEKALAETSNIRGSVFFDLHTMLGFAHGKVTQCAARMTLAEELVKSVKEYANSADGGYLQNTADRLGLPICQALLAYGKEKYDEVLCLLLPLRYSLWGIGGSWAQRQVVTLTTIHAALKGKQFMLAFALVAELKALKPKHRGVLRLYKEIVKAGSESGELCLNEHGLNQS